jgi:hypothetical protein
VTLNVTTSAAGDILPFMVVHKGGGKTSTTMPAINALNLPDDFIVSETPSGYQSKEEFEKVIRQLHEHRVKIGRAGIKCLLFLDGH